MLLFVFWTSAHEFSQERLRDDRSLRLSNSIFLALPLPESGEDLLHGQRLEKTSVKEGLKTDKTHVHELFENGQFFEDVFREHVVGHLCEHTQEEINELG